MTGPGRWSLGKATQEINGCAQRDTLALAWSIHAKKQMAERELLIGDVLHVLRRGFVLDEPRPGETEGFWRYLVEATTPNSGGRKVGVVTVPSGACVLKVVTVMWRDEL